MNDQVAGARQKMVDALCALTARAPYKRGGGIEQRVRRGRGFDVNRYFTIFRHLSIEPGYVLDYVLISEVPPQIYARRHDEPRCQDLSQLFTMWSQIPGLRWLVGLPGPCGYTEHVYADGTEDGYFQLVLLAVMGAQFLLSGHANYHDATIVCTPQAVKAAMTARSFPNMPCSPEEVREASRLDVAPVVEIGGDEVHVHVTQFTKWGGLARWSYTLPRRFPHRILRITREVLVPYDCHVMF